VLKEAQRSGLTAGVVARTKLNTFQRPAVKLGGRWACQGPDTGLWSYDRRGQRRYWLSDHRPGLSYERPVRWIPPD